MVRTRIPEASFVGLLAALATFCALEARGGQPYSIVGQSGPSTAATGRRPLAERIKAANRPIRIASEEELAPDEGLIPALRDPSTTEREWTPAPVVVEFPVDGPDAIAVDEPTADEPAVMPPPDADAVAANPTTADDAGLVGEASTIESPEVAETLPGDGTPDEAAPGTAAPPGRLSETARQPARVAPPRRTAARVTPQRREALLDRLRTALADVPRPLGLVPAPHRPKPSSRQTLPAPRAAVVHRPVPATSLPEPLTAQPAPLPTEASLDGDLAAGGHGAAATDAAAIDTNLTGDDTAAETTVAPAADDSVTGQVAADTEACPSTEPAPEACPEGRVSEEPLSGREGTTVADADAPSDTAPIVAEAATPNPARQAQSGQGQPRHQAHHQRSRAAGAPQPAMTPLDRLQARLENMPRALGLVPAPRPSMHANQGQRRRVAKPVSPAVAAPVAEASPALETVAAADTTGQDVVAATADGGQGERGEAESSPIASAAPTDEPLRSDDVDSESLASAGADGDDTDATSTTEPVTTADSPTPDDVPALVAADSDSDADTGTAERSVVDTPPPAVAAAPRAPTRHTARRPQPARRPIRDALESALANMPRPLGLLPEPTTPAARRTSPVHAHDAAAPRPLATRSIGTRPLDAEQRAAQDISRALVAASPLDAESGAEDTTLTSGSDVTEPEVPSEAPETGSDDTTTAGDEPATLADLPDEEDASADGEPSACIEVTMAGPEGTTPIGERVTLHLTVRNTGSAPAAAVTPVVHFGVGLEPLGIRGRHGSFTADGSVMFDRLAELPPGESVELEVVAVCTGAGTILYQGAAWCGDGEDREIVPADASVTVVPATVAAEGAAVRRR